ncbi:ABC transporter permease (plasmid) [Photobacterium damselae subsp. damselae]|uniref:ABC transporter permease n=1 Tax=Photobacterium damselae TaxID=38293 RepID=UPI001F33049B|nr:FtsX-like permease family protein [Photobacterium damselae]UJZ96546.1 ABC transporter permease [Photobacterium damselae subsp. damselae]UKA00515.1 ABC transporter permease [Photobacterium damselae subsp. damselae]
MKSEKEKSLKNVSTMKINIDLLYVLRILFRCRGIVYPAIISISLGVACITTVLNVGQAMKNNVIESLSLSNNTIEAYFLNGNELNENSFTDSDIKKLEILMRYKKIGVSSSVNTIVDGHFINVLAINDFYYQSKFGKDINAILMNTMNKVAIVPKAMSGVFMVGNSGERYIEIGDEKFVVVNEYDGRDDSPVYIPYKTLREISDKGIEKLIFIDDNPENILKSYNRIRLSIDNVFSDASNNIVIKVSKDIIEAITKNISEIQQYLLLISLILMVVATVNVNNALSRLVSKRKMEFGIRLAYGETKKNLTINLLIETFVICQFGVILGGVLYLILSTLLVLLVPDLDFAFYPEYFLLSIFVGTVSAFFSAITPSIKIMNLSVIRILRDL